MAICEQRHVWTPTYGGYTFYFTECRVSAVDLVFRFAVSPGVSSRDEIECIYRGLNPSVVDSHGNRYRRVGGGINPADRDFHSWGNSAFLLPIEGAVWPAALTLRLSHGTTQLEDITFRVTGWPSL